MKLSTEVLSDTGRKTCSLYELLGHSLRRRTVWVGPEFLFLQRENHRQQRPVKLTDNVPQRPTGASEPWKEGLCSPQSPNVEKEGRVITIGCLEERSKAGFVCVCVCVCVHACTGTQLNSYTDTDSLYVQHKIQSFIIRIISQLYYTLLIIGK